MIAIVDYGMGNLRSVQKALEKLGHAAEMHAGAEIEVGELPPDGLDDRAALIGQ
jgi:imidazoleglycerol phosphate synthase glutamine amidotransferase subunit HisH